MESPRLSKHEYSSFLILMMTMVLGFMVGWIDGVCKEDERKALLQIKASLQETPNFYLLPTWVGNGTHGECCDWERIKCDTNTGYITDLNLGDITGYMMAHDLYIRETYQDMVDPDQRIWSLNFSSFLHFRELRRLDLSWSYINNTKGLEMLGSLKKLEILNLSANYIKTNIFLSLGALTSLKILDLSYMNMTNPQYSPAYNYDISEFPALENLELLDLTYSGCYGSFQMQGSDSVSRLKKLKILNLQGNLFNESLLTSLSALSSLTTLDLRRNILFRSFPSQELSHLTNLKKLDLSESELEETPSIQGCKSLTRLKNLESISIGLNYFNKSVISCLSFLPSLKILDLSYNNLGSSLPMQELSSLKELTTLDLSSSGLESLTLNGSMSNLMHLTLDQNYLKDDDIMRSMTAFPSLRTLSLGYCDLEGRRFGVPNLPHLEILILTDNNFNETLPMEGLMEPSQCYRLAKHPPDLP